MHTSLCSNDCAAMDIQPCQQPAGSCGVEYVPTGSVEPQLELQFQQQLPLDSKLWRTLHAKANVELQLTACSQADSTRIKLKSLRAYLQDAGLPRISNHGAFSDISTAALLAHNALLEDVTVGFRAVCRTPQSASGSCARPHRLQTVRSISPSFSCSLGVG